MAKVSPSAKFQTLLLRILRDLIKEKGHEEAISALRELETRKPIGSVFPPGVSGSRWIHVKGIEELISKGKLIWEDQEQIIKKLIEDITKERVESERARDDTKDLGIKGSIFDEPDTLKIYQYIII